MVFVIDQREMPTDCGSEIDWKLVNSTGFEKSIPNRSDTNELAILRNERSITTRDNIQIFWLRAGWNLEGLENSVCKSGGI